MKYLCYYDYNQGGHPSRSNPPASATKIRYIANCLAEIEPTEIISASGVLGTNSDSARVDYITKQLSIRYFFSMGRKNKILGKLGTALVQMQLLLYLLFNVSKNETIIVYHSLAYMNLVQIAKKIKGFRLILEVEEIYADVIGNTKIRQKEIAAIKKANAYIFPTQLLNAKLNEEGKPAIIIHGTYQVESKMTSIDTDKTKVDERRIVHCFMLEPSIHEKVEQQQQQQQQLFCLLTIICIFWDLAQKLKKRQCKIQLTQLQRNPKRK